MEQLRSKSPRNYLFTPGAERAFQYAEAWESCEASIEITPPELLRGLLAEPECRAALLLAAHGIDERAVLARWPELCLAPSIGGERRKQLSSAVQTALRTAHDLLAEYEQPVSLATEHLLLGLAAAPGEVAAWLAERGLVATWLEAEVHRLAGHEADPTPIEVDTSEAPPGDEAPTTAAAPPTDAALPTSEPVTVATPEPGSAPGVAPVASPRGSRELAGAWRVMDAAANRAGEGLRVVEDYVRFLLDDRRLTAAVKQLRHDLAAVLAQTPAPARHAARNVPRDVGATITTAAEQHRATPRDVALASCKRAQQALRSLEEYAKTVAPAAASAFERLRYRSYMLEQDVALAGGKIARLAEARLYVLLDGQASAAAFAALVDTLVGVEVDMIQLRDKSLPDRVLLERAAALAAATRASRTLFIMNDRADLAALTDADGVHVGQEDLTVSQARAIIGPDGLVGVSTHSLEQAQAAARDGADYIGVGPTFPSQTKQFTAFAGLELARAVAQSVALPAFAIGGIDADNLPQVLAAGLGRVALSGGVTRAADPLAAARGLQHILRRE